VGFLSAALAMLITAIIQQYIYARSSCGSYANSCTSLDAASEKLTVWIQVPIYFLLANSEVLAFVSGQQYAFDHALKNMRSLIQAVYIFAGAIGSAGADAGPAF
jgi:POT family proton-dependent oligopeptide transporter